VVWYALQPLAGNHRSSRYFPAPSGSLGNQAFINGLLGVAKDQSVSSMTYQINYVSTNRTATQAFLERPKLRFILNA
jgi:hypothetical protein